MRFKKLKIIVVVVLVIFIIVLIAVGVLNKEEVKDESQKESVEILLDDNLVITSISSYTGPFVEDGSDELVEDILMITVKNTGEQVLQYVEAQVVFEDITAEFAFSTLRPGETMSVLEKNRLEYPDEKEVSTSQVEHIVYFQKTPDFCEDKFEISVLDGAFNIKNISGNDLTGNIAIYYKNKQNDELFGGITYRVVIEGGMAKDEIRQIIANHYTLDASEIVFLDYTEVE